MTTQQRYLHVDYKPYAAVCCPVLRELGSCAELARRRICSCWNKAMIVDLQFQNFQMRAPADPLPSPIPDPIDPPENPDVPVREPDPDLPGQM